MSHNLSFLETGDIILFSSTGANNCFIKCLDCCIKCGSRSKYTHCGIVIKNPRSIYKKYKIQVLHDLPNDVYILESTGLEAIADSEDDKRKFGVQIRNLSDVLEDFNGQTWYRKLYINRDKKFYQRLAYAHSIVHGKPYDINPIEWIDALFHLHIGQATKQRFFCSALVAYVYVCLGLLPKSLDWSVIRPKDFGTESGRRLNLSRYLSEEEPIRE